MTTVLRNASRGEKGFTLVELAVVMIIIGLLIGGILKGQEMIANAQVSATVAQVKGIDAATSTFRDMYDALPGDITNPQVRLQGCTAAPCNAAGDGNGRLNGGVGTIAGENLAYWIHLAAADLIAGIDASGGAVWGQQLPSARLGGGIAVGFTVDGTLPNGPAGVGRGGHWLSIQGAPGTPGSSGMTASEAARIDRKMDDGAPATGSVISSSDGGTCVAGANYDESNGTRDCALHVRIQG